MKNEREQCNQCPDKYCINSNSRIGRVRAVINKETKALMEAPKTLIEDCPIREPHGDCKVLGNIEGVKKDV